jgi:hypothetical protein
MHRTGWIFREINAFTKEFEALDVDFLELVNRICSEESLKHTALLVLSFVLSFALFLTSILWHILEERRVGHDCLIGFGKLNVVG